MHEGDQGAPPGSLIKTDIALLKTTRIAGAALKLINADSRPEDFVAQYLALRHAPDRPDLLVLTLALLYLEAILTDGRTA